MIPAPLQVDATEDFTNLAHATILSSIVPVGLLPEFTPMITQYYVTPGMVMSHELGLRKGQSCGLETYSIIPSKYDLPLDRIGVKTSSLRPAPTLIGIEDIFKYTVFGESPSDIDPMKVLRQEMDTKLNPLNPIFSSSQLNHGIADITNICLVHRLCPEPDRTDIFVHEFARLVVFEDKPCAVRFQLKRSASFVYTEVRIEWLKSSQWDHLFEIPKYEKAIHALKEYKILPSLMHYNSSSHRPYSGSAGSVISGLMTMDQYSTSTIPLAAIFARRPIEIAVTKATPPRSIDLFVSPLCAQIACCKGDMKLIIKDLQGTKRLHMVYSCATILQLKQCLALFLNEDVHQMRLIHKGTPCMNDKRINEHQNIRPGDTLSLILTMRGS